MAQMANEGSTTFDSLQNYSTNIVTDSSDRPNKSEVSDTNRSDYNPNHSPMKEFTKADDDMSHSGFKPRRNSSDDKEKPDPLESSLSPSEIKEIIQETEDFLDLCLEKVMDQEKALSSLVYRMYHMDSDMNAYKTLVDQQTRYVVNYNTLFSDYFRYLSQALPNYGDFNVALQQTKEETPGGLPRDDAEDMSRKVRDLTYRGWLSLRAQNSIVKEVGYWVTERQTTIDGFEGRQSVRLELVENAISQLKKLVDTIVLLKAQLHYLTIGDYRHPVADYSSLIS